MTTIDDIERILESAGSPDVENLRVIRAGDELEIHGTARTVSARLAAFQMIEDALGTTDGVSNRIELDDALGVSAYGAPSTASDVLDDEEE